MKMTKEQWFTIVKEIAEEARKAGVSWERIYTEKRKEGYRTKFFYCYEDENDKNHIEKLIEVIENKGIKYENAPLSSIVIRSPKIEH